MKHLKYLLFILILISIVSADEFVVKSFKYDQSDLSARVHSKRDVNGNLCAIIKVRTDLSNLRFYSNQLEYSEKKRGEYWLYVQNKTQYFEIVKRNFIKKGYKIPIKVKTKNVYVMELTGKREDKTENRDKKAIPNRKISDELLSYENKNIDNSGKIEKQLRFNEKQLKFAEKLYYDLKTNTEILHYSKNPEKLRSIANQYRDYRLKQSYRQQYQPQPQTRHPTYQKLYQILSNLSNIHQ